MGQTSWGVIEEASKGLAGGKQTGRQYTPPRLNVWVYYRFSMTKVGTEEPPPAVTLSKGSVERRVRQPST